MVGGSMLHLCEALWRAQAAQAAQGGEIEVDRKRNQILGIHHTQYSVTLGALSLSLCYLMFLAPSHLQRCIRSLGRSLLQLQLHSSVVQ